MSATRRPQGDPKTPPRSAVAPIAYKNRLGETYYLHEGTTKTGKPRYFVAKTRRESALASLPDGFELTESVNGVVSVRRIDTTPSLVPNADVAVVRDALEGDKRLARYKVELRKNEIVVHEPLGGELPALDPWIAPTDLARVAQILGIDEQLLRRPPRPVGASPIQYRPVMKFAPTGFSKSKSYLAFRMTYRGEGGWAELSVGPIATLARKYIRHLDRESFFDLW